MELVETPQHYHPKSSSSYSILFLRPCKGGSGLLCEPPYPLLPRYPKKEASLPSSVFLYPAYACSFAAALIASVVLLASRNSFTDSRRQNRWRFVPPPPLLHTYASVVYSERSADSQHLFLFSFACFRTAKKKKVGATDSRALAK